MVGSIKDDIEEAEGYIDDLTVDSISTSLSCYENSCKIKSEYKNKSYFFISSQ